MNDAIKDAAAHHITKVKDILDFVRNELVEKAKGFTCEKILTPQVRSVCLGKVYLPFIKPY